MARPSYGPEAKKRSLHLFTTLFDYANDALECDEAVLDAVRSQSQTHWQTEQRLVVRTKVRFLETLTKLVGTPLTGEQIKESLRRFEDFLDILEDNRPSKGGSEVWHFTLKLWYRRSDRAANLHQFDREWEQRRPHKLKQVAESGEVEASFVPTSPKWHRLCSACLEAQQYQRLTSNPLTMTDGVTFDLHELYVPLGLVERRSPNQLDRDSQLDEAEEFDHPLTLEAFFQRLASGPQQRIAIVGEPGAGKTTLLQKIATWLLAQQALPIWISLADLQGATLENYLLQDWLKQATRQIRVAPELEDELAAQFRQGQVWLLLDAIDELAIDAATALTSLARQLRGWLADAHVVLTCRSNVWDGSKNALVDEFTTYCNLSFSHGDDPRDDQVGQFIDRWFQDRPPLSAQLRQELNHPKRRRIRDAVQNPLRLALLCRSWSLTQGALPGTKALLYQQFVETIYEWKQDRFPTTLAQRQQLNRALGQVALQALLQPKMRFRLSHSFAQAAFGDAIAHMTLALQLGWLNQVGISTTTGEKVYAFYHPTFQEYFAAQAITDWQFFWDPTYDFPVFSSAWREVILLWLGRTDIATAAKEDLMQSLIQFDDRCGNFYSHRAYFLAAAGLAEFPHYTQAPTILAQLVDWRFGIAPTPLSEGARVALLQTDRPAAIARLEHLIQTVESPFARWQAAYMLGKTLDPGNPIAIAALVKLSETLHNETLRLQVIESLGKIEPENPLVRQRLEEILTATQQENIRRRAAYCLGKICPGHSHAIVMLEQLIQSTENSTLRLRTAENLLMLEPNNGVGIAALAVVPKKLEKISQKRQSKAAEPRDLSQLIAPLEQRLATAKDVANQRRLACRLATLQPGHPQAIDCLLQLLLSREAQPLHKRVVEDLKQVLLNEQLPEVVSRLKDLVCSDAVGASQSQSPPLREGYKLLWYCAQRLPYPTFWAACQLDPQTPTLEARTDSAVDG